MTVLLISVMAGCLVAVPAGASPAGITVAAAADLMDAMQAVGRRYHAQTGLRVRFTFGATRTLEAQIDQGAPVDLLCAADMRSLFRLERRGEVLPRTVRPYASGRLVLWERAGHPRKGVARVMLSGCSRIAIANPLLAPYGACAVHVLERLGLYATLKSRLVYGENVEEAFQFARTGNASVALVPLSVAIGRPGSWCFLPPGSGASLEQGLGVIEASPHRQQAEAFAAFLGGAQGQAILAAHGLSSPHR